MSSYLWLCGGAVVLAGAVFLYALCRAAADADSQFDEAFRKWREE